VVDHFDDMVEIALPHRPGFHPWSVAEGRRIRNGKC
jgi:hypothetical protein